ncbi:MAG: beta-propeller domain-containing protein, partial [Candidatus Bathyarchaeota archaeon]
NEIEIEANGEVPGYVLNQFSMDEHESYFRIATTIRHVSTSWDDVSSKNHVYVLDMNLDIVGRLEDLAPGETIYSARFMGERCYLVTFRKIDPLFVIDLEDPRSPRVLGQLKITGYSDYLHPYDENHIIGIGKETVAAEEGNFAWYQGVKISLFDVTDVENPKEIDTYEIGDRGTDSPVLMDHKALLFDKSKDLLVIPVLVAEIDEEKYVGEVPPYIHGDFVWQGAYVFDISLDEGLFLKGGITHLEDSNDLAKSGYYFSSPYSVKRSLYIDNMLYTISDKKIQMNNLEDLEEINEVELL